MNVKFTKQFYDIYYGESSLYLAENFTAFGEIKSIDQLTC